MPRVLSNLHVPNALYRFECSAFYLCPGKQFNKDKKLIMKTYADCIPVFPRKKIKGKQKQKKTIDVENSMNIYYS